MDFINLMEKNEKKFTENGAMGYVTEGHKLVDLSFAIPSYRYGINVNLFDEALAEDERLTLKWLLYLRDIRGGVGERKSFRDFILHLCNVNEPLAIKFLDIVPIEDYGRWDDYINIYCRTNNFNITRIIANKIRKQFNSDMLNFHKNKPISLLAKWLPSINASSQITRENAKEMIHVLGVGNEKHYRKILSVLRGYIDVVERKMSKNCWDTIDYEKVPSKANLIYSSAFERHDFDRRVEYLNLLSKGEKKINANALFLHDIVHKYIENIHSCIGVDDTLEQMWKAQEKVEGFSDTVVVRDGSGSMNTPIGNTRCRALDVADAITIYCAENNTGVFKNKFITFSNKARVINIAGKKSLYSKLIRIREEDDWTNTNIENVFDLILSTAIKNKVSQEDMPKRVLIISDMEFDVATEEDEEDKTLFEAISNKFTENGYKMPKLIFWNVNSRTNTIPCTQNDNGLVLLSGFSKNLMNLVMSSEVDPYNALVKELSDKRYSVVDKLYE